MKEHNMPRLPLLAAVLSILASGANAAEPVRVLFLGDSLTEGYHLNKEDAIPALVEQRLRGEGYAFEALNAGISGSTTASGLSRLRWHLKAKPDILVLALGANDGLRALPLDAIRKNLADTIQLAQQHKVKVLLVGMKTPPNYGATYARGFEKIYTDLSAAHRVPLVPFLLDRVAGDAKYNLADGIHPNRQGHERMAEIITRALKPLLGNKPS